MTQIEVFELFLTFLLLRQLFVLRGIFRSLTFLRAQGEPVKDATEGTPHSPYFYVVLPVLRESAGLEACIRHFLLVLDGHLGKLVVVTTAREYLGASETSMGQPDTVSLAHNLSNGLGFIHLHYSDPSGIKADQLNHAVSWALGANQKSRDGPTFFAFYDADSRPPIDSLNYFKSAIGLHPGANVFHQSSRFEARRDACKGPLTFTHLVSFIFADSEAIRANRFVLGFELPRLLNRLPPVGRINRGLSRYVYAHVTGHGLCIKDSLLEGLSFPSRSPLEDMHYSFLLCSRNEDMVPVRSLDVAEVPPNVGGQYEQLSRWFYGPGRWRMYLTCPQTQRGLRAHVVALSAALISIEWIGCAYVPILVAICAFTGGGYLAILAWTLIAVVAFQTVLANHSLGGERGDAKSLVVGILAFPLTMMIFGAAGVKGAINLILGRSGVGRTVRSGH